MNEHQTFEPQTSDFAPTRSTDGRHFEGRWGVQANSMVERCAEDEPTRKEVAVIRKDDQSRGNFYKLYCEITENEIVSCEFLQTLEYDTETQMLGNLKGQRERCLAFWDLGDTKCIFGMRRKNAGIAEVGLYPWENAYDDGTWGAELEPPLEETR